MGARLRPGLVASIRVSPKDAQSVLHVLAVAGLKSKEKSFSVCVSDALGILLESSRRGGVIPEPDPFQFINELQHHVGAMAPDRRKKEKPAVASVPISHSAHAVTPPAQWVDSTVPTDPLELMEYRAAQQRIATSDDKRQLSMSGKSDVVWSDKDEEQYQRDYKLLYPNG